MVFPHIALPQFAYCTAQSLVLYATQHMQTTWSLYYSFAILGGPGVIACGSIFEKGTSSKMEDIWLSHTWLRRVTLPAFCIDEHCCFGCA